MRELMRDLVYRARALPSLMLKHNSFNHKERLAMNELVKLDVFSVQRKAWNGLQDHSVIVYTLNKKYIKPKNRKVEKTMNKRQINEKLFMLVSKILVENENKVDVDTLVIQSAKVSKLPEKYVFEFVSLMIKKDMLSIHEYDSVYNEYEASLTKLACDKIRELNAKKNELKYDSLPDAMQA